MSNARNIANLPNGDDAPLYGVRAYVVFDGNTFITGNDNVIYKQKNVDSVVWQTTGTYVVNFSDPMPDDKYVVVAHAASSQAQSGQYSAFGWNRHTDYCGVWTGWGSTAYNLDYVGVAIIQ